MGPKSFKVCLAVIVIFTSALLLINSASLKGSNAAAMVIGMQEKGGVVKPSPTPTPKPRSTPRPSIPTPTSSGTRRKTTSPARPRQIAPQIEMVLIPAGTFMMGSPDGVGNNDVHPQHRVTVHSFYMGKYEVTQAQWRAVMRTNPSRFKGDNLPVEFVLWDEAAEFCRKLSQMTGREYRLPSEAEWEYACRAGTTTEFAFGDSLSPEQANFDGNFPFGKVPRGVDHEKTVPVGSYQPNRWGLYDMHGNVWEFCEDIWHDNYNGAPSDGSAWVSGGDSRYRVLRGGSWENPAADLRSTYRFRWFISGGRGYRGNIGLRVVVDSRS